MRVLHTSDWHLGQNLCDEPRTEEQTMFLGWLENVIRERQVDALLVSGDIFDTGAPSNQALAMYYRFLSRMRSLPRACRIVIIGGNHDSPTLLAASAPYLGIDGIHVIGRAPKSQKDEVVILDDAGGGPALAVCAVPFLRPGDVPRDDGAGQAPGDGQPGSGVARHFAAARAIALETAARRGRKLPLLAMGHLFARGVSLDDGERDGERSLVVGNLGEVDPTELAKEFDYVALGHIHRPQSLDPAGRMRYSGAPMTMEFGERSAEKQVLLVDFEDDGTCPESAASGWRGRVTVTPVPVPAFRRLVRLTAHSVDELSGAARGLALEESGREHALPSRVLVEYTGATPPPVDWRDQVRAAGGGLVFASLRDLSPRDLGTVVVPIADLDALTPGQVFDLCLDGQKDGWSEEDRTRARGLFAELLAAYETRDADGAPSGDEPGSDPGAGGAAAASAGGSPSA